MTKGTERPLPGPLGTHGSGAHGPQLVCSAWWADGEFPYMEENKQINCLWCFAVDEARINLLKLLAIILPEESSGKEVMAGNEDLGDASSA